MAELLDAGLEEPPTRTPNLPLETEVRAALGRGSSGKAGRLPRARLSKSRSSPAKLQAWPERQITPFAHLRFR